VTGRESGGYIPVAISRRAVSRMLRLAFIASVALAASIGACTSGATCGGTGPTCPFAPPSHHAVVTGLVVGASDQPLAGAYASVAFSNGLVFVAGPQTDATGRFTITVRRDLSATAPDTLSGWARAAKEVPSPTGSSVGTLVKDSASVLIRFRPRTDPAVVTEATVHLPIAP